MMMNQLLSEEESQLSTSIILLACMPPPQSLEQPPKSETFQRGGQGWSLHVRTRMSGRGRRRQCTGDTAVSRSTSRHTIFDSCSPGEGRKHYIQLTPYGDIYIRRPHLVEGGGQKQTIQID